MKELEQQKEEVPHGGEDKCVNEPEKQKEERHRGGEENTGSHLDKSMKMTIGHMGCVIIGFIIVALSYW